MKKDIIKNRTLIKNLALIVCLIVLCLQFTSSFKELTGLIETNQPYVQVSPFQEPLVFPEGQVVFDEVLKNTNEKDQVLYVRTDTLQVYTYKLIQTILLLFGIFMCLVFMAINNHDFNLIKLSEKK